MKRAPIITAVVAGIVLLVTAFLGVKYFAFRFDGVDAGYDFTFVVAPGESATVVARHLEDQQIIFSSWLFRVESKLLRKDDELRPGTFTLHQGLSTMRVIDLLTNSHAQERRITLIEGWGIKEMGEYLVAQGAVKDVKEWYAVVGTPPSVGTVTYAMNFPNFSFISGMTKNKTLEGFLFPDTYRIRRDDSAEEIARRMLVNFEGRVGFSYGEVERSGKTMYDVVTLASIIEREVRSDEDRKIVADIFQRRLKEGMALQADSTVNYVTGKKTPSLSSADRDIDSPWNTYKHRGLPPSPIGNPSLSAIKAVLDPTPNTYVYFLTDADGRVHYARTLEEHNRNKALYLH